MGYTTEDLAKLGLVLQPDGSYKKPKTTLQPREMKPLFPSQIDTRKTYELTGTLHTEFETLTDKSFRVKQKSLTENVIKKPKKVKAPAEPVHFKGMNITDVYADATANDYIFLKRNVPSLKNSKQIFKNKKTGKHFITSSALCKKYIKQTEMHWRTFRPKFLKMIEGKSKPYRVQFFFVRDKHKDFDLGNASEICLDCMTGNAYFPHVKDKLINAKNVESRKQIAWLEDDNARIVIPNYDRGFGFDPKMAGVIIRVL